MSDYKDEGALAAMQMDKQGIDEYFSARYGSAIGFGYTANIYRDEDRVMKVFSPSFSKDEIFREAYTTACVEAVGIHVPTIYSVRKEGGFYLTESAFIQGTDMLSLILGGLAEGDLDRVRELLKEMGELHAKINHTRCPALPSYKVYSEDIIRSNDALSQETKKRTLRYLAELPDGQCICHGDFHPQNILINSGVYVIDWVEAGTAPVACDPARTYMNLTCLPPIPVLQQGDLALNEVYLEYYLKASPDLTREEIMAWLPIHAAINYGRKEPWYSQMIQRYLL